MTYCFIVTTTLHGQTLNATSNIQISDQNNVADIMVLLEETVENQHFSSILKTFIKRIENDFKQKGIKYIYLLEKSIKFDICCYSFVLIGIIIRPKLFYVNC